MSLEQMKDEEIDKVELEHFRVREELQAQLQQIVNGLMACRAERIRRSANNTKQESNEPVTSSTAA